MIKIKNLQIQSNLFLAPLAGYTNLPFRIAIRQNGGVGLTVSELVNARSLIEKKQKAFQLVEICDQDRPVASQIFGAKKEEMAEAARILDEIGFDVIDLNMGCPVRKVVATGAGAALLTDLKKAVSIAAEVVKATSKPVTVKIRLGWDDSSIIAPELAKALEDAGIAAVTVHGRTRAQGFSGPVRLDQIKRVVDSVKTIPIIANGNIVSPESAKEMFEQTGCSGISIGRGAFYDPWIFYRTQEFLNNGKVPSPPTMLDRLEFIKRHLCLMVAHFGEKRGCIMFRKVVHLEVKGLNIASEFRRQTSNISSLAEFEQMIDRFIGIAGKSVAKEYTCCCDSNLG